ncbi:protein yellow-like [Achroia grisella]|uniref:protein yellow-like n=1 Tax=Achroia grisella TaxID=688607 RepID=UPI0027D2416D|nr:protein yellow-like [Achroia grisella]
MGGAQVLILLYFVYTATCNEQLKIRFQWKELDYDFTTPALRQQAIDTGNFIPKNNIPMGLEIFQDKLFITVPRWRQGVPASLNYVDLKDTNNTSPKLKPYPSWAAHSGSKPTEIISPFRTRIDRCSRLWVLDNGKIGSLESVPTIYPPSIIVYDLTSDNLIRKYEIPQNQVKQDSGFANIAIEDSDCQKTYAYLGDVGKAGLVVYSWEKNESWRISHHFFYPDPLACEYNVKGLTFNWTDAIFGMGISGPNPDGFSTLYFHPMSSYYEFKVSTEYLRNESVAETNFEAFQNLGTRGPNSQSSASFLDQKTGVLFYSLVNLNAVACWKTSNKEYLMKNQGRIYMDDETMVYPTDIKVDYNDNLWVLSNKLPVWMYSNLNPDEVNFRVFSAPVINAISHTACDVTARSDILQKFDKFGNKVKNITKNIASVFNSSAISSSSTSLIVIAIVASFIAYVVPN